MSCPASSSTCLPASSIFNPQYKYIFVNGMTVEEAAAEKAFKDHFILRKLEVEVHHNAATSKSDLVSVAAGAALGTASAARAVNANDDQNFNTLSERTLKLVSLTSAGLETIQSAKDECAQALAKKIIDYFTSHDIVHVKLILHSQGTHVGQIALRMLYNSPNWSPLKGKISVIALGGMVNIGDHLASRVTNYYFKCDLISRVAKIGTTHIMAAYYGQELLAPVNVVKLEARKRDFLNKHNLDQYLRNHKVVEEILRK